MDIVLSQVSELRKLWDLIGYQGNRNESEIFQSFSQWQHERLKNVINELSALISEEESKKQALKHSILNLKSTLEGLLDDLGESHDLSAEDTMELLSYEKYLSQQLEIFVKKHEDLIRDICHCYDDIDLLISRLSGAADEYLKKDDVRQVLDNRLDISFDYKIFHRLKAIRGFLEAELKKQEVVLKEFAATLISQWRILNPKLESLKENEELLVQHMSNPANVWPKDWGFSTLKLELENVERVVRERLMEAKSLELFIETFYEEFKQDCPLEDVSVLQQKENLSQDRLAKLRDMKMQVDTLRKEAFERELARYKQPLSKLWESLRVSSEKQIAFLNGLCEIPSLEQISQVCNKEIARLSAQETFLVDLFKMLDTRTNLIAEMKDFESKASDPKRLFAPSFRLLYEEKFRKTAYPNLLKLEKRIMASLDSYKQEFAEDYLDSNGESLQASLEREISTRYLNDTIFEFGKTPGTTLKTPTKSEQHSFVNKENGYSHKRASSVSSALKR